MAEARAVAGLDVAGSAAAPRIGPNAIIRVAEALVAAHGEEVARAVFAEAGLVGWLDHPPGAMVPEADVAALHRALIATLSEGEARGISATAGRMTATYLLANRIPRIVQMILKLLPATPSARLLLRAIGKHAWTFVGSGTFVVEHGPPVVVMISGGPLRQAGPAAACVAAYYAATFEALFRSLVHPKTSVAALRRATEATAACAFSLSW